MKHLIIHLTLFQLFLIFNSCFENESSRQDIIVEDTGNVETVLVDSIGASVSRKEINSIDTIQLYKYKRKLEEMFQFSDTTTSYKISIDTIENEKYLQIKYKYKIPDWWELNIYFEIFSFKSQVYAINFYNDLYTREHIFPFGIEKRLQYIVRTDSTIIWHHFNSSYSHRFKSIKKLFVNTFDLKYNQDNSDSIVGSGQFSKDVKNENALNTIKGKYYVYNIAVLGDTSSRYERRIDSTLVKIKQIEQIENNAVIHISDSNVFINGQKHVVERIERLKYPSTKLYFKYLGKRPFLKNKETFRKVDFIKVDSKLTEYCVFLNKRKMIYLIVLPEKKKMFINGAFLYELKK